MNYVFEYHPNSKFVDSLYIASKKIMNHRLLHPQRLLNIECTCDSQKLTLFHLLADAIDTTELIYPLLGVQWSNIQFNDPLLLILTNVSESNDSHNFNHFILVLQQTNQHHVVALVRDVCSNKKKIILFPNRMFRRLNTRSLQFKSAVTDVSKFVNELVAARVLTPAAADYVKDCSGDLDWSKEKLLYKLYKRSDNEVPIVVDILAKLSMNDAARILNETCALHGNRAIANVV